MIGAWKTFGLLFALCSIVLQSQLCRGSVFHGHFAGMQSVMEHESEIFHGMHEPGADGLYRHEVHVTGEGGRSFDMKYEGKFKATSLFHNMENDVHLTNFGCTDKAVILKYDSHQAAHYVYLKLSNAPDGTEHILLTGRQLWECPPSFNSVPEFDEETKMFGKKNDPNAYQPMEGVRRVRKARLVKGRGHEVIVETERGFITDVFEHLELEGSTNMMPGGGVASGSNEVKVVRSHDDPESALDADYVSEWKEEDMVRPDFFKKLWKKAKRKLKKFGRVVKKGINTVVRKVIKPVVKVVKRSVMKVVNIVKQPKKWLKFIGSRNLLYYALRPITRLLPELSKSGSFRIPRNFELNYDARTGRGSTILTLGNMKNVDKTKFRSAAEFTVFVRRQIRQKNAKMLKQQREEKRRGNGQGGKGANGKKKKPAKGAGKFSFEINLYCLNCFVRFRDNRVHWKLSIGGAKLAMIRIDISSLVELMVEFYAQVTLMYEYTIPLGKYPIPFASIPFGPYTLGFALQGDLTLGINFKTPMFYYRHHYIGRQSIGYEHSLLGGRRWHHSGRTMRNQKFGPIVYTRVAVGLYMQPSISLVFSDIAAVAGGVVPNIEFGLVPVRRTSGRCSIQFEVTVRMPLVVGVWVGFRFGFKTLTAYKKSVTLSFLPIPRPLLSGCISTREFEWFGSRYGQPITAEVALPKVLSNLQSPVRQKRAQDVDRKVVNRRTRMPTRAQTKSPTKNPTAKPTRKPTTRMPVRVVRKMRKFGGGSESEEGSSESLIVKEIVVDEADVDVGKYGYLGGFLVQYRDGVVVGVGFVVFVAGMVAVWVARRNRGETKRVPGFGEGGVGTYYGAINNSRKREGSQII